MINGKNTFPILKHEQLINCQYKYKCIIVMNWEMERVGFSLDLEVLRLTLSKFIMLHRWRSKVGKAGAGGSGPAHQ